MTARAFLDGFSRDERLVTGAFFSEEPVLVEPGDTVGVVLMHLGGPTDLADVERFLYDRFMDPAAMNLPLRGRLREWLCRFAARRRARGVGEGYEQIGGLSPVNRHAGEQARALEARLNDRFGPVIGARFRAYTALRYGQASSEAAARQMVQDRVDKVILLPLYPQYSRTMTGSSLGYWKALEEQGEVPAWPTALVHEYAAHPKLVQAISERIDEGLQRFPRAVRGRVRLVFAAHGTPLRARTKGRDPYCCLVHATVQGVMGRREAHDPARAFHVAFQRPPVPTKGLTPTTPDTLEQLADEGHTAVLVVPVSFVSDHVETVFGLDIAAREDAYRFGIEHFEVTSELNCHPLFIEALAECVAAQVTPASVSRGDGADALPAALPALPRYTVSRRTVHCPQCPFVTEAHDWSGEPAIHVPAPAAVPVPRAA